MDIVRRVPVQSPISFLGQAVLNRLPSLVHREPIVHSRAGVLNAVLMRAGTSKGLFLHRRDLPWDAARWPTVLSAAMGSQNSDKRQLDGLGGASSTTSKAAVISPSLRPDADVDYTFAQIAVGKNKVDLKGSCGNICAGVGAFALEEGLVQPSKGASQATIRVHDTNSGCIISQTLHLDAFGQYQRDGTQAIPGYSGTGSPIKLAWQDPCGTTTEGRMLPTGNATDLITVPATPSEQAFTCRATLIDVTNPFVFVDAASLPSPYQDLPSDDPRMLRAVEEIRCRAAVMYGLANSVMEAAETKAIPKIGLLHPSPDITAADVRVVPFSMGKPHPSFQLTGVMCLSAALSIPGTVASDLMESSKQCRQPSPEDYTAVERRVLHSGGVGSCVVEKRGDEIMNVGVTSTAGRIFKGQVWVGGCD